MKHLGLSEIVLVLSVALLFSACTGSPSTTNNDSSASPAAAPSVQASPLTGFEKDLQFIRNGQYTYVWVFSRKDGKALEPADSIFLRANAPQVVDWVTTDGGKKVIAGTNFNLEEGNLELLKRRYAVEDYTNK
jgi:hypothetical protein